MIDEKVVDTTTQETVDTETQDKDTVEAQDLVTLIEHYKAEAAKYKEEAKNAYKKRDEIKKEYRAVKENSQESDEVKKHIEQLQKQLDEKELFIKNIEFERTKENKLKSLIQVAKEQGLKESYIDKLEKFVDLDEVDPAKNATMRYQLDIMRSNFPDLFSDNGKKIDKAMPMPNLKTAPQSLYLDQYNAEKRKGIKADMKKLMELKKLIDGE